MRDTGVWVRQVLCCCCLLFFFVVFYLLIFLFCFLFVFLFFISVFPSLFLHTLLYLFMIALQNIYTKYIRFALVDSVNNTDEMSTEKVDELLLHKEKFWIGSLVTQHKGLNGTHDWCRKKRCDKTKNIN